MTKQEAIKNHRVMWNWIADQIEYEKQVQFITMLKEKYITGNYEGYVKNNCFCCQYDCEHYKGVACAACPIDWLPGDDCCTLYSICWESTNYEEQAKYARQIANLPEMKGV